MIEPDPRPGVPDAADGAPPLGELMRRLSADAATLVRQEVALARAELRASLRALLGGAGRMAAGAALASIGVLVLLMALVLGLGDAMGGRYWLSAAIVGAVLVAAGAVLLLTGLKHARAHLAAPAETLAALRETGEWAKGEVAELRSALSAGRTTDGAHAPSPAPGTSPAAGADPSAHRRTAGDDARSPRRTAPGKPAERNAPPPLEWPLWKRVWTRFQQDDVSNQAAKVSYFFFMSLPPLLMAAFGLAGIFGGQETADWLTANLRRNLPPEAGTLVNGFVNDVVHKNHPGLLSLGLLLALWSGAGVFMAL
ncbi:MAG TPA: YhjD/YihY/BrkB family envelope integrity protein, partial [Longimicrobium sp.]